LTVKETDICYHICDMCMSETVVVTVINGYNYCGLCFEDGIEYLKGEIDNGE